MSTGHPVDAVVDEPSRSCSRNLEMLQEEDIGGGSKDLFAVTDHYEDLIHKNVEHGDWAGALDALNAMEEELLRRGVLRKTAKVKLHLNRAYLLEGAEELPRASEEIQKAIDLMRDQEETPGLDNSSYLHNAIYVHQARVYMKLQDPDAAHASLDKAAKGLSNGNSLRDLQLFRVLMLKEAGQFEASALLTGEVAMQYVDAQSKLGIEAVWVPFLDRTGMPGAFRKTEALYRLQKNMTKALIWAERSRTRLFLHRAKRWDAKEFDRSDQYAEDILFKTIELCGPGTVIIECSIHPENIVVLYALFDHQAMGIRGCASKALHLDEFFNIKANCAAGKSVEEIVLAVRKHIGKGEDERAIPGLTILHSLLVQSILDQFQLCDCTNILFAPQGLLHRIPFAALYDASAKKFLIEQKSVGVIPSIRSLHHSFVRQQLLEDTLHTLDGAFIAGDPEPMGLGLEQLPGAAQEAQQVADILGVEACKGEHITKEAVFTALKTCSLVLLATHGFNDPDGAVVLRRAHTETNDVEEGLVSHSEQEELLTFDEFANVGGGIRAGLVCLSGCQTGLGDIRNEGMLSLGHAVLQAGAVSAMVALWDVDDNALGILMTDIFKELKKGTDILHSVQKAMVDMLRSPEHRQLSHWSGLTVLGSPTFRLPSHMQAPQVNDTKECLLGSCQLLAEDIGGGTMYFRAVVQNCQDYAWQQEQKGDFAKAIAAVNWLEQRLQAGELLSAVAKSKLQLWRVKYLMQSSTDGSLAVLKAVQKAIEGLPDIERTPELAAEIFLEQAKACLKYVKDREATSAALDRAQKSLANSTDSRLLHHIKVFRTIALSDGGEFEAAAALARESQLEAGLGDQPVVWVPFVDDEGPRNTFFRLYEIASMEQGDLNKAVVWAERGRTSVFGDDGSFDGNDSVAVHSMLKTKALCGPDSLIIYLSYHQPNNLFVYGVHYRLSMFTRVRMKKIFSDQANCVLGSSLEELVSRVRKLISEGEDEKALPGLSILYKLLVSDLVDDYKGIVSSSTSIIFAPQGFLSQIPFAALYDSSSKKFLVEQNAVGVVPSIRALRGCFSRQQIFEAKLESEEDLNASFVGGNPEPMGCGLEQLPQAGQAAKEVGGILNVEVYQGNRITKKVLLQALSTRRIVMLATQGVGGRMEQPYPYGAVVLKQETVAQDEVLTCEELASLKGTMSAGLVVLTVCHKGQQEGTLNNEGLLGLGHAALEGGAVSVMASLWDVSDSRTEAPLISATFRELKRGSDVLHSVQKAMVDSVRSSQIRHWASLTVLGSPTLRIHRSVPHQPAAGAPKPGTSTVPASASAREGSRLNLGVLRKACLEWFTVSTEAGPTTLDTLPPPTAQGVLEYLAQQRVAQLLRAEEEADLNGQIFRRRDLGMIYGAMGEWSISYQNFVRSISVAKDNWELVQSDQDAVSTLPLSGFYVASLARLSSSLHLDRDLSLVRFVLQSSDPTNGLLPMIRQFLAVGD